MRDELARDFALWSSTVAKHTHAEDGTEKLLLTLADGGQIECVLLRDVARRTICISTAGRLRVRAACFVPAASTASTRNLTTGEIVEQMLRLQSLLRDDERLSHIVVMGMGEPLANLDALLPSLDEASRDDGLGISARRITISIPWGSRRQCVGWLKPPRAIALPYRFMRQTTSYGQKIVPVAKQDSNRRCPGRGRSLLRLIPAGS